jgi:hypothetical protein
MAGEWKAVIVHFGEDAVVEEGIEYLRCALVGLEVVLDLVVDDGEREGGQKVTVLLQVVLEDAHVAGEVGE